jgi:stage II sporulation protein D
MPANGCAARRRRPNFGLPLALAAILLTAVGLLLATGTAGCHTTVAVASPAAAGTPVVRVRVAGNTQAVELTATAPPVISGRPIGSPARLNLPNAPVRLSLNAGGWLLGDQTFPRGELTLTPATDGSLRIDGRAYRGSLRIVPRGPDRFDVVNDLDVESYLMGVLPKELPADWSLETYKAQAIVARTYAIFELKTAGPGRGHFDLFDTVASQVYGGMDAETPKSRQAVDATRGQVVTQPTDRGPRIFKAYFHSTSGGVTLGNDAAFNEPPIEALSAQSLGEYGRASSRHRWEPIVIGKPEMTRRVRLWGDSRGHPVARMATVDKLEIVETNPQGRPTRFELTDVRGRRYSLIPEEIRWALNTDRGETATVFSGYFRPINNETNIVLADGRGWGHGVGMCQWSAEGMADAGVGYRQIVLASYPGTSIVRAY